MSSQDIGWQGELDRRARVYEDIEAGQRWEGTMTRLDYAAIVALTVVLVVVFWIWGLKMSDTTIRNNASFEEADKNVVAYREAAERGDAPSCPPSGSGVSGNSPTPIRPWRSPHGPS